MHSNDIILRNKFIKAKEELGLILDVDVDGEYSEYFVGEDSIIIVPLEGDGDLEDGELVKVFFVERETETVKCVRNASPAVYYRSFNCEDDSRGEKIAIIMNELDVDCEEAATIVMDGISTQMLSRMFEEFKAKFDRLRKDERKRELATEFVEKLCELRKTVRENSVAMLFLEQTIKSVYLLFK